MAGLLEYLIQSLGAQAQAVPGVTMPMPDDPAAALDPAAEAELARVAAAGRLGRRRGPAAAAPDAVDAPAGVDDRQMALDALQGEAARTAAASRLGARRGAVDGAPVVPVESAALPAGGPMAGILGALGMPGMQSGGFKSPYDEANPAGVAQEARDAAAGRMTGRRRTAFTGLNNGAVPFAGMLSQAGLLNAPGGGVADAAPEVAEAAGPPTPADLPPSTNDPMANEPQVFADGVPLPRPRPISPATTGAAPLAMGAPADEVAIPPEAKVAGPAPAPQAAAASPGLPGQPSGGGSILDRISNSLDKNGSTLMALGAGFAGAPSFGTGMRRAFAGAAPAMAADRANALKQNSISETYKALVLRGVPAQEALAAVYNPDIMKATAAKYFETKPLVAHEIGTDRFGNKIMGTFNPNTGEFRDTAGRKVGSNAPAPNSGPQDGGGVSGDAFLQTLPDKPYADKVKAIAEGREPFPQGQIMRSPYGRKLGEDVLAYDPSFDAVNYKSRENTRKSFTSGKDADNVTSLNTTIGHLGSLSASIEKLNNSRFPFWNTLGNWTSGQYDPKFQQAAKEFQAARTAVADELTRSFRLSGGNVHDIKAWEATINQADSPQALRGAVKQAAELLQSRIEAVGDKYNKGMGTTKDPVELLRPRAAAAFQRMHEQDPQVGPGKIEADTPAPSAVKLAPGAATVIDTPQGKVTIKRLN